MLNFELKNLATLPDQLQSLLDKQEQTLEQFLAIHPAPSYEALVSLLESQHNELHLFWAPVSHLNAVKNTDALRATYEKCLPLLSKHSSWFEQHVKLFHAFEHIKNGANFRQLTPAQQKYVNDSCRDFKLAGVHLPDEKKKVLTQLQIRLSELINRFEQNIMDASDAWQLLIEDVQELSGLPEIVLQQFVEAAAAQDKKGYLLHLQAPCFMAVITYADNRELRQKMYEAWITRASDIGPTAGRFNNTSIMFEILSLRQKLAELLGFPNYAEYALTTKMAKTPQVVDKFLENLICLVKPLAEKEFADVAKFAAESLKLSSLQPWDVSYASEKLKHTQLHFDDETLRPYFPLPMVLQGLFHIAGKLFGIGFKPAPHLPRWHKDVEAYEVQNEHHQTIAYFYCDLYARQKKRGGAWMDDAQSYWAAAHQLPIAFLTCNFSPPLKGQPALLTHEEVITLFHEFGHGLHQMLSKVEVLALTGTHVEWDAVELPSQIMENWCWEAECLALLSQHYQTREALPENLLQQLLRSKNFLSGMFLARQLEFALFDLRLHWKFDEAKGPQQIQACLDQVRQEVAVVPILPQNRFQHSFSHIFAGGYSAGYYSYLWAEVLAADAFSLFTEQGILSSKVGQHFKETILEKGGAEDADILFKNFRGRAPQLEALLKSYGLLPKNSIMA